MHLLVVQTFHSIGANKNSTVPKNKTDNKTVEIKMDTLDIQTNIIMPCIKFKIRIY